MDSIQFIPADNGFTLMVRAAGWLSQKGKLIAAGILFGIAGFYTYGVFHGLKINDRAAVPFDSVYVSPLWAIGLALLAFAFQGAYRRVAFIANTDLFVIAISGPLGKKYRQFARASLRAVIVGDSSTVVNGRALEQLKIYFADRGAPVTVCTGREHPELCNIAKYLTESLGMDVNSHDSANYLEVRYAPLHAGSFKLTCGICTGIGLIAYVLRFKIGTAAMGITFMSAVITALVVSSIIQRKARCPKCNAVISRDGLSDDCYLEYTCPACRIVWQSPIRVGGYRSR